MSLIMRMPWYAALAAALVVGFTSPVSVVAQATHPTFAGTWKLNPDKTGEMEDERIDDADVTGAGKSRRLPGTKGQLGGGTGANATRGSGGGGGGRGGMSCRGGGGSPAQMLLCDVTRPIETLIISQDDSSITFDRGSGMLVKAIINGKTEEQILGDGSIHKVKATWKKEELVVERDFASLGSTKETIRFDKKDPKLLLVDFHFENKRERHTMDQKRAYALPSTP